MNTRHTFTAIRGMTHQVLTVLIAAAGFAALLWGAAMLVGGFLAADLLDNPWNPMGQALVWTAAFAIMGANALFYHVLVARKRKSQAALVGQVLCVLLLTAISTMLQTYVTQRGANGQNILKAKEVAVHTQGAEASRIDRDITGEFDARIGVIESRMHYEAEENGGKGPKYRAARAEFDRLSERYVGTLGLSRPLGLQRQNVSEDAAAVRAYLNYLREKVQVYRQFAQEVGIMATDYEARLAKIEPSLSGVKEGVYIDEKSVIYIDALNKIQEMFASGGTADLAFTIAFLVSIGPDIVQLLCALLLFSLRPKEEELEFDASWSPFDRVWGESPDRDDK